MQSSAAKQSEKAPFPKWVMDALSIFEPPERLTVSEWADKYRVLSEKDSDQPGKWRTNKTPYLREIMNTLNNPKYDDITFVGGTQLGKTVAEQNMIAFIIDQDPGPMMVIYPTEKLAGFTSENRIQPMIELCERLNEKFQKQKSQRLELQFSNMYIALIGANSPSDLSSRPVRFIFFDEIDKFPMWAGKEAGPLDLAEERTKTFWNRKKVKVSTPTLKSGNIWRSWEEADIRFKFFVPCPHCGEYQELVFKNVKFDSTKSPREVKHDTYYECESCKGHIEDRHKKEMLRLGKWKPINRPPKHARKVAYHMNSIYSPWVTFGDVAEKFMEAKDSPEKLMNFVNSWLAEPWENKANRMKSDVVLEKMWTNERGRVPEEAQLITMGVDVQKDHFWVTIRAWGPHLTSWLIDYGRRETWGDIETLLETKFATTETGEVREINLAAIDAGYDSDEVYRFVAIHQDKCIATKGSSKKLQARYNVSNIDKYGLKLFIHDSGQFKDFIAGRLHIEPGENGAWHVCKDCERMYADQICAEQKTEKQEKNGRISYEWQKISSHAQNHLLDCEVNAALAAEVVGVRYLREQEKKKARPAPKKEKTDWIGAGGDWL